MTKFQTQTEYADHRGISQPRVSKMISTGQIPASCMKRISGRKLIDRDKADQALSENLDKIRNPNPEPRKRRGRKQPTKPEMERVVQAAGLEDMSLSEAQRLQANYKASLLQLELAHKAGEVEYKVNIEAGAFALARQARDAVLNIPDRIGPELLSCTELHDLTQKLTAALLEAMEELST